MISKPKLRLCEVSMHINKGVAQLDTAWDYYDSVIREFIMDLSSIFHDPRI